MKKILLTLSMAAALALPAYATSTISGTPSSQIVNLASTNVFNVTIQLTTSGPPPTDLVSVNLLLETLTANASYFTAQFASGSASFPTANNPGGPASFNTASTSHSGYTDSNPSFDLGANIGGGSPVSNSAGVTNLAVDTVKFTIAPNTPNGTYFFAATLGFPGDPNGTFIEGSDNIARGLTSASQFSITVVPEPSTWAMLILGGLGVVGLQSLRARRRC